jgi:hypothetical protein
MPLLVDAALNTGIGRRILDIKKGQPRRAGQIADIKKGQPRRAGLRSPSVGHRKQHHKQNNHQGLEGQNVQQITECHVLNPFD